MASVIYEFGGYAVYVNDVFWGTCENRNEVEEELEYIKAETELI